MTRLSQYPITATEMANAILRAVLRPQPLTVSPAAAAVWRRPLPMPTVVNLDLVLDAAEHLADERHTAARVLLGRDVRYTTEAPRDAGLTTA